VNVSEYQRYSDNYHNRTNIAQIARNHKQCTLLNQQIEDKSFLIKTLEAKLEAEKPFADYEVRLNDEQKRMAAISERDSIIRQLLRENKELDSSIRTGLKFAQAFYETDDTKALEVVNDVEIKKSMMFNISLEEM
jgi:hypothetical protein